MKFDSTGVVKKAVKKAVSQPKFLQGNWEAQKRRRRLLRTELAQGILSQDFTRHLEGNEIIKNYEKLFLSLYWSFTELQSKIAQLDTGALEVVEAVSSDSPIEDEQAVLPNKATENPRQIQPRENTSHECRSPNAESRTPVEAVGKEHGDQETANIHPSTKHRVQQEDEEYEPPDIVGQQQNGAPTNQDIACEISVIQKERSCPDYTTEVTTRSFNQAVLIHLRCMLQDQLTVTMKSALAQAVVSRACVTGVSSVSRPVVMRSGHIRMSLLSDKPLNKAQLEFFEEDAVFRRLFKKNEATWVSFIELAAMEAKPFRIKILGVRPKSLLLSNTDEKLKVVRKLFELNPSTFQSMINAEDILDILWHDLSPVLFLASRELANKVLDNGLLFDSRRYNCEMLGADQLFSRCHNCQEYGHHYTSCDNQTRCSRCGLPHAVQVCKSLEPACAVCLQSHLTESFDCMVRAAIRDQIKSMRFPSIPVAVTPKKDTTHHHLTSSQSAPPSNSASLPPKPSLLVPEPAPPSTKPVPSSSSLAVAPPASVIDSSKSSNHHDSWKCLNSRNNHGHDAGIHENTSRDGDGSNSLVHQINDMQKRITALQYRALDFHRLEAKNLGMMDEIRCLQTQVSTLQPPSPQYKPNPRASRSENPAKRRATGPSMGRAFDGAGPLKRIQTAHPFCR